MKFIADDPLMAALVFFGTLHARPVNTEGAIQGLPVVDGVLSPELFTQAASRCGFESKIVIRSIKQLHSATLPVILLMEGNEAVILTSRINKKEGEVIVLSSRNGTQQVNLKELEASYSGIAIMVKPSYKFEGRSDFNGKTLDYSGNGRRSGHSDRPANRAAISDQALAPDAFQFLNRALRSLLKVVLILIRYLCFL